MDHNDFFCHLPFVSIWTDGKQAMPCCRFQPKTKIPLRHYAQHAEIIEIKKQLFQGRPSEQCRNCVDDERNSGQSLRTLANQFHPHFTQQVLNQDANYHDIKNVDIVGGNVCNLMCLPCLDSSYVRSQELYELGLRPGPAVLRQLTDLDSLLDQDLNQLTLCSGEPFYDKQLWHFLQRLVEMDKSKSIALDINSNLTSVTANKLDFLRHNFRTVLIKASIDGVGPVNEYLRYPSKWQDILRVLDQIQERQDLQLVVTTALSNLALIKYSETVNWALARGIANLFISQVTNPPTLAGKLLPATVAQHQHSQLQTMLDRDGLTERTRYAVDLAQTLCESADASERDVARLVNYMDKHDRRRGTDWRQIFTELVIDD